MYRLVLYGLGAIVTYAFALSAFGALSLSFVGMAASLVILLASCVSAEYFFSNLYGSTTSVESVWITAMIIFLTLAAPASLAEGAVIAIAGILAIASKYVLSIDHKHVFNPAAISLVLISLAGSGLASWWVGSPLMLPIVAIVGFLIVRKIHRFDALAAFTGTAIALTVIFAASSTPIVSALSALIISGPLVFFSTIMLTEPLTMPPSRPLRIVYGIIVGGLYASPFHIGILYATPHLALALGNVYSYAVSQKEKVMLKLRSIERLSANVYEFAFRPSERLAFASGQYLEWTLPHQSPDSGGNRRYFTISSSPLEEDVRVGVRIDENASSFKRSMLSMREGDAVIATSLSGDFTLPDDRERKLLFIAGGVGITPFASMIRYLIDSGKRRDIDLFYMASHEEDLAYRPLISEAERMLGLNATYVAGQRISRETLRGVADLAGRECYISGPDSMVKAYKSLLVELEVPHRNIHTDYFTGFGSI